MQDQLQTAFTILKIMQAEMLKILAEMGPDGMNWAPNLPEVNSPYAITYHSTASQYWWIQENLNGQKIERNRPGEFVAKAGSLDALEKEIERVNGITRAVFESIKTEDLQTGRQVKDKTVTVEWIVLHVIEHTAIHLGHLQLTKQLWEGRDNA
jgi:hypothetical protein